jgi:hypothetical protein
MSETSTLERPRLKRGDTHSRSAQVTDKRRITGPYSRLIDRGAIGDIDGTCREGRFLRHYEQMLIEHCGGNPSITQRALISRTARLALHLELMDERALKDGRGFGPTDHHFYVSWSNALARHLDKLALKRPPGYGRDPDLAAVMAELEAAE